MRDAREGRVRLWQCFRVSHRMDNHLIAGNGGCQNEHVGNNIHGARSHYRIHDGPVDIAGNRVMCQMV